MAVKALSYIGVNSDKLEDWSDYSEKCLGMQRVDRGKGALSFRMDDHTKVGYNWRYRGQLGICGF